MLIQGLFSHDNIRTKHEKLQSLYFVLLCSLSALCRLPEAGSACTLKPRQKEKKKSFSVNEKCGLLTAYEKLPKTSQRDAAVELGVPQATSCSLLKQWETVTAARDGDTKQIHIRKAPVVKTALIKRFDKVSSSSLQ